MTRCAVCGRSLAEPGKVIPGIGVVGPKCYRKFAAFELVLGMYGAEELAHGGALELTEQASLERIREVDELIRRLRRAGVRVRIEDALDERGVRVKRITLGGIEPRAFRKSFEKDLWEHWWDDLRLRQFEMGTWEVSHA